VISLFRVIGIGPMGASLHRRAVPTPGGVVVTRAIGKERGCYSQTKGVAGSQPGAGEAGIHELPIEEGALTRIK
jgi:hypothetical protein